jgi:signal transduction histidine kinase
MEDFHEDWIYTDSKNRAAHFTNLDPGTYTFRVKGSNNDGLWNEEGTSIKIHITPPYWQTWWFRGLLIVLVVCIGLVAHYTRIQRLKRLQKAREEFSAKLIESQEMERKRIASGLHDSLGQNLLIVNNEIQQYLMQPDPANVELEHIAAIVKDSIREVREISYNLHPHQLERLGLTKAIESSIQKISHSSGLNFEVVIDDIDRLLHEKNEIHFFRIVQEILNNIIKHSEAQKAQISIKKNRDRLEASVKDFGKGFSIKELHGKKPQQIGLGLSDISERTRLLRGSFSLHSEPGKGTQVDILIPISTKHDTAKAQKTLRVNKK